MNKAVFTITMILAIFAATQIHGQKAVDLSIDNVWPALQDAVPNPTIEDTDNQYYGGYRLIPKHLFSGFSSVNIPVNHPGGGSITFDWELSLTKNPDGAASVVFNETESHTLSSSDILNFGSAVNFAGKGEYRVTASLSSPDDANNANNTATFDFELTDTEYGYANPDNLTSTFTIVDFMGDNADAVGIELYFPSPTADDYVLNSFSTMVSDQYTGVVNNGNAFLVGVIWGKDGSGNWDLSTPLFQTDPRALTPADFNTIITVPFAGVIINDEREYLLAIHIFNNADPTDGGRIALAADPNLQGPEDMRCVTIIGSIVNHENYTPAIWANIEPQGIAASSDAEITAYELNGQVSSSINAAAQTISVTMPNGADLSALTATFTLSAGASATVGGVPQVSATTTNNFASPITYVVTAEDGTTTKNWTVNVQTQAATDAEITAYELNGQVSSSINAAAQTISVTMPNGANISALTATFSLSAGASATVGGVPQVSATTTNNFASPITYVVTAEDATTTKNWTVNVQTQAATDAEITAYELNGQVSSSINAAAQTISVTMPNGADLSALTATFTLSAGASATVSGVPQVSATTTNNFASPVTYVVTAEDGTTTKNWTVNVQTQAATDAEITAYELNGQVSSSINAAAQTISVTMPNGTDLSALTATFTLSAGASATVGGVPQVSATTTNNFGSPITYVVTAEDGTTTKNWTVNVQTQAATDAEITAYELNGQVSSSINAAAQTISVTMPNGADLSALTATFSLSAGASATVGGVPQVSATTTNNFGSPVTYVVTAEDGTTTKNWTVNVQTQAATDAEITAYELNGQVSSSINAAAQTISVTMPNGADLSALPATFSLSAGASATVGGVPQVSATTTNNFSTPVTYVVTAEDGTTTKNWTVTVQIETSDETDVISFELPGQVQSQINTASHNISVLLPQGSDLTNLVASFELSPGAVAHIGGVLQESEVTTNNFVNPVTYTVTASDGVTTQNWTVLVSQMTTTTTEIVSFDIAGQSSPTIFSGTDITVYMPQGSDVTNLIPTFTLATGATVSVGGVEQTSGINSHDFSSPIIYTVTAFDGITTEDWTVSVEIYTPSEGDFLSFSIIGQYGSTIINPGNKTIAIQVFDNADITSLVAEFELPVGSLAYIGSTYQESGVTANDFSSPITYQINGQSGNVYVWTVTVTQLPATATTVLTFEIPNQLNSLINNTDKTISVTMPAGTNATALVPTFSLSPGAIAEVNGTLQESGVTANDFSQPVTYTITAADGITVNNYTVTVFVESTEAEILSYSLPGETSSAQIDDNTRTIEVTMPAGTDVSSLVATFTLSDGATAHVGATEQISGATANNFETPVVYNISASDGVTQNDWTVTVTVEAGEADILTYALPFQISSAINQTAKTVSVVVPIGTDLTALAATFTLSDGAEASVGGIVQESGVSLNNFTTPITYEVTSLDGQTINLWTVNVTEQQISAADFLTYAIDGNEGEIDYLNALIRIELPAGYNLNALVADYTTAAGTTVKIGATVQESGVTVNNFTNIVKYKLTPQTGAPRNWYVIVTIAGQANDDTEVLYYGFYGQTNPATINASTNTISVNLDPTLNVNQLIPMYYLSDGAIAFVNGRVQWSGENMHNFTNPVTYTIVAEDGTTSEDWTVVVTTNQNASTDITVFRFEEIPQNQQYTTIYSNTGLIYVDIPAGTDRTALTAEFQLSPGASAKVNGVTQQTGETVNNFSSPIIYNVMAQDNITSRNWTVAVRYYLGTYEPMVQSMMLYPNPARDFVNIELPENTTEATAMLIDMRGRTIKTLKITSNREQLLVSDISEGVYLLLVQTPTNNWTERLIIQ